MVTDYLLPPKVPDLASSRWKDVESVADAGQLDPLLGVYCERDHNLWLVGSLTRLGDGTWQQVPFYRTGDAKLILLKRNITPSLTNLYRDQPFRVPTLDLPIEEWLAAIETGRAHETAPDLSQEEAAELRSLETHDAKHVWLNDKAVQVGRERLALRCHFCSMRTEMRLNDAASVLDRIVGSGMREISLKNLQNHLGLPLDPPR